MSQGHRPAPCVTRGCLVSKRWTEIQVLQILAHSMPLTLANGQQASCLGPLQLNLKLQAYHGSLTCHVLDLPAQYNVTQGEALQRQTNAISETDEKGLRRSSLLKNGRRVSVKRPSQLWCASATRN